MKIQYLLTLQVSRYHPLVLQSCTVAAVPGIEHCVCPVSRRYLVEQNNIHASHLDGPGRCQHPKFEVVIYRGAGVFQVIRGLKS